MDSKGKDVPWGLRSGERGTEYHKSMSPQPFNNSGSYQKESQVDNEYGVNYSKHQLVPTQQKMIMPTVLINHGNFNSDKRS